MNYDQHVVRTALRNAQTRGVITMYALRPQGRATIYPARGGGTFYTTGTTDTLMTLRQIEREHKKGKAT